MITLAFIIFLALLRPILAITAIVKFVVDGDLTAAIVCLALACMCGGKG